MKVYSGQTLTLSFSYVGQVDDMEISVNSKPYTLSSGSVTRVGNTYTINISSVDTSNFSGSVGVYVAIKVADGVKKTGRLMELEIVTSPGMAENITDQQPLQISEVDFVNISKTINAKLLV